MKKIGIAGIGGIGSNVALNLTRTGISYIKFVDFDIVNFSNLNRQFYFIDQINMPKTEALYINLKRINPNITLDYFQKKITKNNILDIFNDCDIIVDGFDNTEYKKLLIETFSNTDKFIVSTNGIAHHDISSIKILQKNNIFIVGDFEKDVKDYQTFSHKVTAISSIITEIILKIINQS